MRSLILVAILGVELHLRLLVKNKAISVVEIGRGDFSKNSIGVLTELFGN